MKRRSMIMTVAMLLALGGAVALNGQEAQAAKKQKVKAVVKGSTLTISGKGAMPSSLRIKQKQRNKVKKIVIKKGITSIPIGAFVKYKNVTSAAVASSVKTIGENAFKCQKLKKLTLPGDFKIKAKGGYWISGKVNTVAFNTNLNPERAAAFDANNLVVKKTDPKYKSIGGVIYSKDGKEIVRVPFQRSEIVLDDGCEVFCLQSVLYANADEDGEVEGACRIRKIVIPASVKQVESASYLAQCQEGLSQRSVKGEIADLQVEIQSRQMDDQSLSELVFVLQMGVDNLMKQMPDRITRSEDMYFVDKNSLLMYKGKESEVTIPAGTTKIGNYAFRGMETLKEVILPEGLTEIGKESFSECSLAYEENTFGMKITFPSTLKKIGDYAFSGNRIRQIVLPDSVEVCGKRAFAYAGLTELTLPASLKVIPEALALDNDLTKIVIPDSVERIDAEAFKSNSIEEIQLGKNVKEIGELAFWGNSIRQLTIPASVTEIAPEAFWNSYDIDCNIVIQGGSSGISDKVFNKSAVLIYTKGPQEQKISLSAFSSIYPSGKAVVDVEWTKVQGADGYELIVATNAKFTKNRKKVTVDGKRNQKTITLKKINKKARIYVKGRPYTYLNGKKVYGKWSAV